jgi:hypothetical protein
MERERGAKGWEMKRCGGQLWWRLGFHGSMGKTQHPRDASPVAPNGTRWVRGRICHLHTHTRSFSLPLPPASIPAVGSSSPPYLHSTGFSRPDGYPLERRIEAAPRR